MEKVRKAPALERNVKGIDSNDIKVRVIGKVSRKGDGFFVLEDESGEIRVNCAEQVQQGQMVRVFGRPVKEGDELRIESDLVQDMAGLDAKLYKKLKALR
jgi:hypothetical protein